MRRPRPTLLLVALLVVSLVVASCGATTVPPGGVVAPGGVASGGTAPATMTSDNQLAADVLAALGQKAPAVVGRDGGLVYLPNGPSVWIPPKALSSPQTITITPEASPSPVGGATDVGSRYAFGPEGLQFAEPVTILLEYDPKRLPPKRRAPAVRVFTAPAGSTNAEQLPTTRHDATHVSVRTTHFSWYQPAVPSNTLPPFEGPFFQLDVFDKVGSNAGFDDRNYDASSSLNHAQKAGGVADRDMPVPDDSSWPDVPVDLGWNQEICGIPFLWNNQTQNLLSDEAGAPDYDPTTGDWKSGAKGDTLVYVFKKPRRATHVEMLVTSVMGHASLMGKPLGRVEVTYEDGTVDKLPLVLGQNLRNNHYFLPDDPAMRLPMAQFTDFVREVSDKQNVCKFKTRYDQIGAVHYELDRVRLPLSHDAVHKRKKVKQIVVRNMPRAVLLPGVANTVAPVVQKVQYSGLQIWGLTLAKEYPIIVVPGIMGTSLSKDGLSGVSHEPWLGALTSSTPATMNINLQQIGFDTSGAPNGVPLQKCELVGLASYQSGPLDFFSGILSFMQDSMGYRLAKSEKRPHEGKCWQEPSAPDPKDDCTLREDLYTFPYDWRKNTLDAANELKSLVQKIKARTGAEKVDIVAHSLGGVVSRIYLAQGGAENVDTYITLGTPFYGAPKVFSMTRYGQTLTPLFQAAQRSGFKETSRNMWGVYTLLPSEAYVASAGPYFTYEGTDVPGGQGAMDYPTMTNWLSTATCGTDWYDPDSLFCRPSDALYYNPALVAWARNVHALIDHWDLQGDDAPWKYAIVGTGHSTLVSIGDRQRPREFIKSATVCEDGDGSVAPKSALGFPKSVREVVFVKAEHAVMPGEIAIQKQIQLWVPGIEEVAPGASRTHTGEGRVSDCDMPP